MHEQKLDPSDEPRQAPAMDEDAELPPSDLTAQGGPPAPPPVPDVDADVAPLEHVVDDLAPKEAAADWVYDEMHRGRALEDLTDELLAQGWSRDDADEIVEFVRKETRRERGVRTREDVAKSTYASYATSIGRLPYLLFGGIFIVASNLLRSLRGMRQGVGRKAEPLPSTRQAGVERDVVTSLGEERPGDGQNGE